MQLIDTMQLRRYIFICLVFAAHAEPLRRYPINQLLALEGGAYLAGLGMQPLVVLKRVIISSQGNANDVKKKKRGLRLRNACARARDEEGCTDGYHG